MANDAKLAALGSCNVDCLITGDKDLLALPKRYAIATPTPLLDNSRRPLIAAKNLPHFKAGKERRDCADNKDQYVQLTIHFRAGI